MLQWARLQSMLQTYTRGSSCGKCPSTHAIQIFSFCSQHSRTYHLDHPSRQSQYSENKFSWKRSISQFSKNSIFQKLTILYFKETAPVATVTFTAHILQNDHDATFTEKSYFEKYNNRWLYRGGQLSEGHAPNMVTTGQLRLRPLTYFGDPILRRKADLITDINEDIHNLWRK